MELTRWEVDLLGVDSVGVVFVRVNLTPIEKPTESLNKNALDTFFSGFSFGF